MMIKRVIFVCIILLIVLLVPVSAQTKETLAVLDFTTEAVSETEMSAIVEFLSAELFKTNKYIVIDVSQRETILQEMEFSMSGCSDESCALEIGKMLSAELIVLGNLSKIGSRYLMSVKMLQTETSRTIGTANGKYADLDEMIDGLETIAFSLAGQELAYTQPEVVTESVSESEVQPIPISIPEDAEDSEEESEPVITDSTASDKSISDSEFNWLGFSLQSAGSLMYLQSGVFGNMSLANRLLAYEAYDAYMEAVDDPGALYSGDGDEDYDNYYGLYERDTLISYAGAGLGGILSASAGFAGDSYKSFGGRIAESVGTLFLASGNLSAFMAANQAISNISLYNDYSSAIDPEQISLLYTAYEDSHKKYKIKQYVSYSLWGAGSLLSVGSWFLPGEKTNTAPSLLHKIITGAGYLVLTCGNFTSQIAVNTRVKVDAAYVDYQSAGNTETAADLYTDYENLQSNYEAMTYATYGLWGAGTAAVITALFLPPDIGSDSALAEREFDLMLRPSLTGIGLIVDIDIK